jgi:hypothetical protein
LRDWLFCRSRRKPSSARPSVCADGVQQPSYKHIETQPACFGLLKDGEDRWHHLKESLDRLRAEAVQEHPKAQVKLIYLGRHGQGELLWPYERP